MIKEIFIAVQIKYPQMHNQNVSLLELKFFKVSSYLWT